MTDASILKVICPKCGAGRFQTCHRRGKPTVPCKARACNAVVLERLGMLIPGPESSCEDVHDRPAHTTSG